MESQAVMVMVMVMVMGIKINSRPYFNLYGS